MWFAKGPERSWREPVSVALSANQGWGGVHDQDVHCLVDSVRKGWLRLSLRQCIQWKEYCIVGQRALWYACKQLILDLRGFLHCG